MVIKIIYTVYIIIQMATYQIKHYVLYCPLNCLLIPNSNMQKLVYNPPKSRKNFTHRLCPTARHDPLSTYEGPCNQGNVEGFFQTLERKGVLHVHSSFERHVGPVGP